MAEVRDFIRWKVGMKLGIPLIDEQHANLLRIIDNLQLTCDKSADNNGQRFIGAANEAIGYVKYHFATEEKLMRLLEYPEYAGHREDHKDFLRELMSLCREFKSEENPDFQYFVDFLNEWVVSHVCDADRNFVDYFYNMQHHSKLKVLAVGALA